MAGNQQGKTYCACFETAVHLLGDYPTWWDGRTWDRPTAGWAIGVTTESTRDTIARLLLGRPGQLGTGLLPKDRIISVSSARGVADAPDTVQVSHSNGGISTLGFKSYGGGVAKLMGETLDFVHLDESPEPIIYTECLARTNATQGIVYLTLSPVEGLTPVVELFYPEPNTADRYLVRSEIEDALHIPEAERQRIIDRFPPHEREARVRGIPAMGSGRVFPVTEESIVAEPFSIPAFWPSHHWHRPRLGPPGGCGPPRLGSRQRRGLRDRRVIAGRKRRSWSTRPTSSKHGATRPSRGLMTVAARQRQRADLGRAVSPAWRQHVA
jgi:phage terminase large subunit-like protein